MLADELTLQELTKVIPVQQSLERADPLPHC